MHVGCSRNTAYPGILVSASPRNFSGVVPNLDPAGCSATGFSCFLVHTVELPHNIYQAIGHQKLHLYTMIYCLKNLLHFFLNLSALQKEDEEGDWAFMQPLLDCSFQSRAQSGLPHMWQCMP